MRTRAELALAMLAQARRMFASNIASVTLNEALQAADGYRSILGIAKHAAAWSHVYHSYAFDKQPRHWQAIGWPGGLRDTIQKTQSYLDEIVAWAHASFDAWEHSLQPLSDGAFDEPYRCHWGATMPLFDLVTVLTNHWVFHTGELNAVLSIIRAEAWEYTEEVEENHIPTLGHRVRPTWMNDEQAARYEADTEGEHPARD